MTISHEELLSKFMKMEKMVGKTLEENQSLKNKIRNLEELSGSPSSDDSEQNHTKEELDKRKNIDKSICVVLEKNNL